MPEFLSILVFLFTHGCQFLPFHLALIKFLFDRFDLLLPDSLQFLQLLVFVLEYLAEFGDLFLICGLLLVVKRQFLLGS